MLGVDNEIRIYSEEDVFQSQIDFLEHGDKPPAAIGKIDGRTFVRASTEDLKRHNEKAGEKIQAKIDAKHTKPGNVLRKVALVFMGGMR